VHEDSDSKPKTPDPERAMNALAWAIDHAERGITAPAQPAEADDFRAATQRFLPDVRRAFDRIIMASDPELGLDSLLECGALSAMLPEVNALVGFGDGEWRHKDV
jgi:poly(A) polymerase